MRYGYRGPSRRVARITLETQFTGPECDGEDCDDMQHRAGCSLFVNDPDDASVASRFENEFEADMAARFEGAGDPGPAPKPLYQQIPFKVTVWPTGEEGVAFSSYEVDGTRFFRVWIDDATPNQNIKALVESEFRLIDEELDR